MAIAALILTGLGVIVAISVWGWTAWARSRDKKDADVAKVKGIAGAEREAAEALVYWLSGRRVLWNPMIKEIPDETVRSVEAMRERAAASFGALKRPEARIALERIEDACLELLDEPRKTFDGFFSSEAKCSLERLRAKVRPAVETLAMTYEVELARWRDYRGGFEDEGVPLYVAPPKSHRASIDKP